jgi:RTX calcium-binding nonapeptide repeat (4 copies)
MAASTSLLALAAVLVVGKDRLFGGEGADSLNAKGGGFDVVGGGPGRDTVRADRGDRVGVDCEGVTRS